MSGDSQVAKLGREDSAKIELLRRAVEEIDNPGEARKAFVSHKRHLLAVVYPLLVHSDLSWCRTECPYLGQNACFAVLTLLTQIELTLVLMLHIATR